MSNVMYFFFDKTLFTIRFVNLRSIMYQSYYIKIIEKLLNNKTHYHGQFSDISRWEEDDKMFVETHNFPAMLAKVKSQSYVTFVGVPGSGKTATARHIALKLRGEGYEVLSIKIISDIDAYGDPHNPQVFVIDDILGVHGLNVDTYHNLNKYEYSLKQPTMPKSKVLMTCRELVYRYEMLSESFLCKQDNVVLLNSDEYALNDNDKLELLEKYQLGADFLSSSELKSPSNMFPFLCKLSSSVKGLKWCSSQFFTSPVPFFLNELQKMRTHTRNKYASLVLLMANEGRLSKEMLDNITNDNDEMNLNEKRRKFLEACKVSPDVASFKLIDALSEMEGTYTKSCGIEYTFVHDSMFEIVAYHFGLQCQELMLQYMSSDYVAHHIKLESPNKENKENNGEKTCDDKQCKKSITEKESAIDLCIKLQKSQHKTLAVRLFRDVENGEMYNVFGNEALKHPSVLQDFIDVMKGKTYTELHSIFLSEMKETFKPYRYINPKTDSDTSDHLRRMIHEMLINKRFKIYHETSLRAISWVIYHGHHLLLQHITDRTIQEYSNANALFLNSYNKDDISNEIESLVDDVIPSKENTNIVSNNFLSTCRGESVANYSKTEDSENNACSRNVSTTAGNTYIESEIRTYSEPVIVEQNRLLCLGCYSGDLNTVSILLKHVNGNVINIAEVWHARSYWEMDPLSIACSLGYLDIATKLITAGANVNQKDYILSPLICACENGHNSVVEKLINARADVNEYKGDRSPLGIALYKGNFDIVQKLIKAGADVNHMEKDFSLLTEACLNGHFDIVEKLVKFGADVNLTYGVYTPLTAACFRGHLGIVKELIKAGADVNRRCGDYTPLLAACVNWHLDIVKELIAGEADANQIEKYFKEKLNAACCHGHLDIVQKLIKAGADVNLAHGGYTPLSAACYHGHLDVVQELIKAGSNVNLTHGDFKTLTEACSRDVHIVNLTNWKYTALTAACFHGHLDVVEGLITAGADVNLAHGDYTPLTVTCFYGHLDVLQNLIKAGADVNSTHDMCTPLTAAILGGTLAIVKILIDADADVNLKNVNRSPLGIAFLKKYFNIAQQLIKAGADVNRVERKSTLLIEACLDGHVDVVEELITARADVNLKHGEYTPLIAACHNGHNAVVEKLINEGADVNVKKGDRSPLGIALSNKNSELVQKLIRAGADVDHIEINFSLLTAACNIGHCKNVKQLIKAGAVVNPKHGRYSPLTAACSGGYLDIVQELISEGADVNLKLGYFTPLTVTCLYGHLEIIQELIKAGASVNHYQEDDTPLTVACEYGHLDVVKTLIEAGANENQKHGNNTPLSAAYYNRHLEIVKELISRGDDCNIIEKDSTLLIAACLNGHLDVVEKFIKAGADVNQNHRDYTPLTAACVTRNLDIVKELIAGGADVNLNDGKNTPLTAACYHGHFDIVENIIEAGADVNLNDGEFTPLKAANFNGHLDIVQILTQMGANDILIDEDDLIG